MTVYVWREHAASVMAQEPEPPEYTGTREESVTVDEASTLGGSLFWLRGDRPPETVLS